MRRYFFMGTVVFLIIMIGGFISCSNSNHDKRFVVSIDPQISYQTISNFGASDAWRCHFVGGNWPEEKKEQMAQWLFSQEFDDSGSPKGIGLSLWRFYIGSGSMEQGDSSGINHSWRRTECFQEATGDYNWDKQKGQQWFLKKAKEYGVEQTMAFTISAPVHMTINEKAFSPKKNKHFNIKPEKEQAYARFLIDVCEHFDSIGLSFDYLSPFNEPQWEWNGPSQEGTPATNEEIFNFVSRIDYEINNRNIKLRQTIGEAADIRFLTYNSKGQEGYSDQISTFLHKNSQFFIGNLKSVEPIISGHSYFTSWPVSSLIQIRKKLKARLDTINPDFNYWQSEFCILEKNDDIVSGHKRDLGMGTALYVSRVIHSDLTLADASAWHWWTAISQCDYKDGLIYLDNGDNGITNQDHPDNEKLKHDGNFHDSKLMWALGNYSRFIRPGMIRIQVELSSNDSENQQNNDVLASGFINKKTNELVLVIVNYTGDEVKCKLKPKVFSDSQLKTYTTSEHESLSFKMVEKNNLRISPKSVITIVGQCNSL